MLEVIVIIDIFIYIYMYYRDVVTMLMKKDAFFFVSYRFVHGLSHYFMEIIN